MDPLPLFVIATVIAPVTGALTGLRALRRSDGAQRTPRAYLVYGVLACICAGAAYLPHILLPAGELRTLTLFFAAVTLAGYLGTAALIGGGICLLRYQKAGFGIAAALGLASAMLLSYSLSAPKAI